MAGGMDSRLTIMVPERGEYDLKVRHWVLQWLLSAVALLIVANIVPGIEVDSFGSALVAAVVIGLVSATLGFFLKLLLLPFIIITLGVLYFLINGTMLMVASALVPGFRVRGLLAATGGSIVLTIVDYLLSRLV